MPTVPPHLDDTLTTVATGRYLIHAAGAPCGEETWRIAADASRIVAAAEQVMEPPHPFPNRQRWSATLTPGWRVTGLDIEWTVGERVLTAVHRAEGARWNVSIAHAGQVRGQAGDYPDACEVEFTSHLSSTFILARRDFALGGEHEFPVLRIGPPWMAVDPQRMLLRCVERGVWRGAGGEVPARRYVLSLPPRPESEGYTFWADEHDIVLESFEGPEPVIPWMRLVEHRWG